MFLEDESSLLMYPKLLDTSLWDLPDSEKVLRTCKEIQLSEQLSQ